MMVNLPLSGNSCRVKVPSSPVVVLTLGSSFTRITVPMRGSPVLLSLTTPSSVCAWMAVVAAARSAALSKILFIYITIDSSFITFRFSVFTYFCFSLTFCSSLTFCNRVNDFSILVNHRHSELLLICCKYRETIGWTAEHGAIDRLHRTGQR